MYDHFFALNYKKILFYLAIFTGVVFISLVLSVFLFKDRIIRQFIAEANKYINTPVKVGEIDVSILSSFPSISIIMSDLYVEDSHPGEYPLITAKTVSFRLNPIEVYRGIYTIRGLSISDSETNLKIDGNGQTNYDILKPGQGNEPANALTLELNDVRLRNTKFSFYNLQARQHYTLASPSLDASIRTENDLYFIKADGEVGSDAIEVAGKVFAPKKSFQVKSDLVYDDNQKRLRINPSLLQLKQSVFSVSGNYGWKTESIIDLHVDGKDTDIQTLLSLLPSGVASPLEKYKSRGEVFFKGTLSGPISQDNLPAVDVTFGFNDATIFHPEYRSRIESASLNGSFRSTNLADERKAELRLGNIKGTLNGEPFRAEFSLADFSNPLVNCVFAGNVDAAAVHGFFPFPNTTDVSGRLHADVSFRGRVQLLKQKSTAQQVSTSGTIDLKGINLRYGKDRVPLTGLSGTLQFSNNDLALSNVAAKFGNSDFVLNGFFKNIITYLLFDNQPVGIESDLKSDYLDVNQLLRIGYAADGESASTPDYEFDISRNVFLNFNCDIRKLVYRRFVGQDITGDLLVKNKVAVSRKLSLQTMGGALTMSGIVDSNNPKAIDVMVTAHLKDIHLDSAFYVFENFNQDFILDKHLKGHVTADVNLELTLNQNLKLFPETILANINTVIRNGELNDFEPMKKLNRFLDDESLSRLRFADLANDIRIEKKTVFIPNMRVGSNVTDIQISGTHTFDQQIDYRLVTPLRGRKKFTDSQAGSAVGSDNTGKTMLFLKISGTTDDYKVSFDTEAVKNKIAKDLKEEIREIKSGFKNREKEKGKVLEVQEDEYFDW